MNFRSSTIFLVSVLAVSGCATVSSTADRSAASDGAPPSDSRSSLSSSAQTRVPPLRRTRDAHTDQSAASMTNETRDEPTLMRGTDRMYAPPKTEPPARQGGSGVSLKFEQAPVTDVVHAVLGDILKVPYSINQPVTGTITLHTHTPLARDKVFSVFESLLQANGLHVVKDSGGVYHVGRPETLRGVAPSFGGTGNLPAGHNMVIVPLQYVGAVEMADILKPVANPEAFIRVDTFRNLLVLAGSRPQIEGWMEIVSTFDIDVLKGMSLGLFPLKHTSVKEVDAGLKAVLAGAGTSASGPVAAQPAVRSSVQGQSGAPAAAATPEAGAVQLPSPIAGVMRVVALDRLNALLVITPRAHYLDIAREWIAKFDQPRSGGSEPQLYVYPVQNGTAQHLAGLLNAIFGGEAQQTGQNQRSTRAVAPGLGSGTLGGLGGGLGSNMGAGGGRTGLTPRLGSTGDSGSSAAEISQVTIGTQIRVVADDQNNALLLYAPASEYGKIEAALRKLDVAPTQVLIEASILEVSLNDELKYGLQWYFDGAIGSRGWSGQGQLTSGDSSTIGVTNPGFSYTVLNPLGQIRAVLNALAQKSLLNVISSPSIMVLDNHTAQIHVGDQQPIRATQTVTDGGTTVSSIQYKDTGVMLSVSPSVNAGGMVTMQIEQSVTDVGQVDIATGQRTFLQRQLSSRVAVRNGETIVLGGLIRDNNTRDQQGLPLLHDIPVLGNLFGTTAKTTARTELLVMLTPRVVNTEADLRQVGAEMRSRMRSLDLLPGRIGADASSESQNNPVPAVTDKPAPAQDR